MGNECSACTSLLGDNQEVQNGNNLTKSMHNSTHAQPRAQTNLMSLSTRRQGSNHDIFKQAIGHQDQMIASCQGSLANPAYLAQTSSPFQQYEAFEGSTSRTEITPLARHYFSIEDNRELETNSMQLLSSKHREKAPAYRFKSGAIYEGEWIWSLRDGYGVQSWPDGARYEGNWEKNKASGKGRFQHVDGDIYEGEWNDDKANGFGTYLHVNGAKYEGQWKDDLQHGYGVETWADGSKYEGSYKEGKKDGIGTYIWPDGSKFSGNWQDNKINGFGEYTWLDGRKYEGNWMENNMHGCGVYSWKDGRQYQGEYYYDKKHGFGIYTWTDGRKYEGFWELGKQHGKGKYTQQDEIGRIGIWQEGKRLSWIDKNDPQHLKFEEELQFLSSQIFQQISNANSHKLPLSLIESNRISTQILEKTKEYKKDQNFQVQQKELSIEKKPMIQELDRNSKVSNRQDFTLRNKQVSEKNQNLEKSRTNRSQSRLKNKENIVQKSKR